MHLPMSCTFASVFTSGRSLIEGVSQQTREDTMTIERQAMNSFLTEHAKDRSLVPEAFRNLELFFHIAEQKKYPLVEVSDDVRKKASAVLSGVFQTDGVTIELRSIGGEPVRVGQSPEKYWECYGKTGMEWSFDLRQNLLTSFWVPLAQCLEFDPKDQSYMANFGGSVVHEVRHELWNAIGKRVRPLLHSAFSVGKDVSQHERTVGSYMGRDEMGDALWSDAIKPTLEFYLGFILGGERARAAQLQPLLALLTKAIPVGERNKGSGAWIVFVA